MAVCLIILLCFSPTIWLITLNLHNGFSLLYFVYLYYLNISFHVFINHFYFFCGLACLYFWASFSTVVFLLLLYL